MNNACLFLAGKIMNEKKRESHYCMHYHNMKHQGTVVPPLGIKEMAEVKNKISIAEAKLLRTIEFNFNIPLPYSYLNFYISTLYPGNYIYIYIYIEEQLKMKQVCTGIVNDVFLTTIPLRSSPRALSISCIIIGAILLGMPPLYDKYFREDDWMNVKNSSIMEIQIGEENMFMELTEEDYLAKTWTDRVHPTLKLEDIIGINVYLYLEIVEEISALYESALKEK